MLSVIFILGADYGDRPHAAVTFSDPEISFNQTSLMKKVSLKQSTGLFHPKLHDAKLVLLGRFPCESPPDFLTHDFCER
jgi:hypothetical protein